MRKKIFILFFLSFFLSDLFSQGIWTQKASLPDTVRFDAMYFTIGTNGYVIGGADAKFSQLQDVWVYDAINNMWIQKQKFPAAKKQPVSFSIGSKGYHGTGGFQNDFWEYDPVADSWTQKANLPADGRNAAVGFSIGNKGYLGTGNGGSPQFNHNDFWEYNPLSNSWTQKANIPGGRSFAFGFSIGAKGYIGTGYDSTNTNFRDDLWEYDTTLDSWFQKTNFPGGKRTDIDGAHFVIGNYAYIGTGKDNSNVYYNDFWKYNPTNDTWSPIPSLPASSRIGMSAFSMNNKGYIGLGYIAPNTCFNDLWEYDTTTVGIVETKSDSNVNIYPNPFSLYTTFTFSVAQKNTVLKLFDAQGKQIKRMDIPSGAKDFLLKKENLESGVYFYHILSENKTIASGKLVVQ